ncbi:DUF4012 domain-containing protein [Kineococcus sp. SYSU DK005]|uniref:DUF4012 domain-containing protein n=1 Tax=Kineococcus sp. SYSU DK005 TaxID=3383126 RepID=UPI003D7CC68C
MPGPTPAPASPARRRRRAPRAARAVLGVLLLLLLAWAAAVAVSGVQAARALQRVADAAPGLAERVRAERFAEAVAPARAAAADAAAARRATAQWPYRAAERVPWVGAQLRAASAGAAAAAALTEPLPAALGVAGDVLAEGVVSADRRVDVEGVQRLAPVVVDYRERVEAARSALAAAEDPAVLEVLARRLEPVAGRLDEVAGPLGTAAELVPRLPGLLGAQGARTYVVAFTNPAEVRPVQGIVGAYAYVSVDGGRIELTGTGTDAEFGPARGDSAVNGGEYAGLYGGDRDAGRVQNLTVGAQADDAARLTASLFADAGKPVPDAVVLVDPVGLAQLLGADHAPLDLGVFGEVATADLPRVLMEDAYVRFAQDNEARKAFLASASAAAFEAVLADGVSTSALRGGREAVASGHLAVWSAREEEQRALVAAGLAGVLGEPRAAAHVGLTNVAPSKLDYWTRPRLRLQRPCATGSAEAVAELELTLTNPVPEEVPDYVQNQVATTAAGRRTARDVVSLWVPPAVGLDGASVDGRAVPTSVDAERGWRLVRLTVELPPGEPVVVRWRLRGPAQALPAEVTGPSTVIAPEVSTVPCEPPATSP